MKKGKFGSIQFICRALPNTNGSKNALWRMVPYKPQWAGDNDKEKLLKIFLVEWRRNLGRNQDSDVIANKRTLQQH